MVSLRPTNSHDQPSLSGPGRALVPSPPCRIPSLCRPFSPTVPLQHPGAAREVASPSHVEIEKWRILAVGEVHDQPADPPAAPRRSSLLVSFPRRRVAR
jgi:hypothetical protein